MFNKIFNKEKPIEDDRNTGLDDLVTDPVNDDVRDAVGQRPINGRNPLTDEQVMLINQIIAKGNELGQFINVLIMCNEVEEGQPRPYDARWIAIAQTTLQHGIADLIRAVEKPGHF